MTAENALRPSLRLRLDSSRLSAAELRGRLIADLRQLENELRSLLALADCKVPLPPLEVEPHGVFSAWASSEAQIGASVGCVLAIDDFLSGAFSRASFFAEPVDADTQVLDFEAEALTDIGPGRFSDYDAVLLASPVARAQTIVTWHKTPWRLAQLDLVATLTTYFLLLHEYAHVWYGHALAFGESSGGDQAIRILAEAGPERGSGSELQRACELEADAVAFQLLRELANLETRDNPLDIYAGRVSRADYARTNVFCLPEGEERWRIVLTAAGIAILLIEHIHASRGETTDEDDTHPSPAVRLVNLVATALFDELSPLVDEDAQGELRWAYDSDDPIASMLLRRMGPPLSLALLDLESVAALYRLERLFPNVDSDDPGVAVKALVSELMKLTSWETHPADVSSPAVADFLNYSETRDEMRAVCAPYRDEAALGWLADRLNG